MTAAAPGAPAAGHLGRRVASGLLLAVIALGSVATVPTFTLVVLAITLGALWELAALTARKGQELIFPVGAIALTVYIVLAAVGLQHTYERMLLASTIIASLGFSLLGERQGYFVRSASTVFGVLYIGWLASYFLALRNLPNTGAAWVVACIVTIAFTDIFAMVTGKMIGRTPLTSISPQKTWEGAIGGFAASVAVGASFGAVPLLHVTWLDGAAVGAFTSFAAQIGDIVESALKRDASVKDAGTFMPGHGGILDRLDSYLFGGIAFYAALYATHHVSHL